MARPVEFGRKPTDLAAGDQQTIGDHGRLLCSRNCRESAGISYHRFLSKASSSLSLVCIYLMGIPT